VLEHKSHEPTSGRVGQRFPRAHGRNAGLDDETMSISQNDPPQPAHKSRRRLPRGAMDCAAGKAGADTCPAVRPDARPPTPSRHNEHLRKISVKSSTWPLARLVHVALWSVAELA